MNRLCQLVWALGLLELRTSGRFFLSLVVSHSAPGRRAGLKFARLQNRKTSAASAPADKAGSQQRHSHTDRSGGRSYRQTPRRRRQAPPRPHHALPNPSARSPVRGAGRKTLRSIVELLMRVISQFCDTDA